MCHRHMPGIKHSNATVGGETCPITYRLSATPTVQMGAPASRVVTFTIVSGT